MVYGKRVRRAALLVPAAVLVCALRAEAQPNVKFGEHEVDFHGFMQQGFVYSTGNNFLTMASDDGSAKMTDGGINASTKITDKLRVGTQLYVRSIGQFGAGHLELDWAFADYHLRDWIGFRGGKVKTQLGLINDTQDMEFLHTWALLPQAVYPLDLRSVTIAHSGADVYGTLSSKKAGSLAYTVYGGAFPDDRKGGYRYGIEDLGLTINGPIKRFGGGFDLRWTMPVEGLQTGFSRLESKGTLNLNIPGLPVVSHTDIDPWRMSAVYGDYQKEQWHFSGEWRRQHVETRSTPSLSPGLDQTSDGWFLSAAYRVAKPLEIGTYYSRFIVDTKLDAGLPSNHISGPVVTSRFDLTKYVSLKVEGHFVDGYGSTSSPHGYYLRDNPTGLANSSNMLVVRTAVSF
jgi:hypothetical protein